MPKGTKDKGSTGRGFDVTQSDRTRRIVFHLAGLMAVADRHLDKRTLGQLREQCRMYDHGKTCNGGQNGDLQAVVERKVAKPPTFRYNSG